MLHLFRLFGLVFAGALLAGCISGSTPFYDGVPPATPLPAEFVLVGESSDETRAWKVTLDQGVYVWRDSKETMRSRLYPLTGEGVPAGFYVAALDDDQDKLYGIARIDGRAIRSYVFDAAAMGKAFGIAVQTDGFTDRLANRADLEKLFALVAARLPAGDPAEPMVEGVKITVGRFTSYDPAVPAERDAAAEMLSKYGAD